MVIDNKYDIGQIVYCKTDKEQNQRIISCIIVTQKEMTYVTWCGTERLEMYEFEMSSEKDILVNI